MIGLTRAVAAELAGTGVRVNAGLPALVRTEMTDRSIAHIVRGAPGARPHRRQDALAAASPLGRLLEPEEVADGRSCISPRPPRRR